MPQHANTSSPRCHGSKYVLRAPIFAHPHNRTFKLKANLLSFRNKGVNKSSESKSNGGIDRQAAQRITDFMLNPGPDPFRHETITEAERYMADRIREFEFQFNGGSRDNGRT
jgi:hypothetical protein